MPAGPGFAQTWERCMDILHFSAVAVYASWFPTRIESRKILRRYETEPSTRLRGFSGASIDGRWPVMRQYVDCDRSLLINPEREYRRNAHVDGAYRATYPCKTMWTSLPNQSIRTRVRVTTGRMPEIGMKGAHSDGSRLKTESVRAELPDSVRSRSKVGCWRVDVQTFVPNPNC